MVLRGMPLNQLICGKFITERLSSIYCREENEKFGMPWLLLPFHPIKYTYWPLLFLYRVRFQCASVVGVAFQKMSKMQPVKTNIMKTQFHILTARKPNIIQCFCVVWLRKFLSVIRLFNLTTVHSLSFC